MFLQQDVLAVVCLKPAAAYIAQHRHIIAKTIESRTLLEEFRGAERRSGSPPRQFWSEQEMNLEDEDDVDACGRDGGVSPCLF